MSSQRSRCEPERNQTRKPVRWNSKSRIPRTAGRQAISWLKCSHFGSSHWLPGIAKRSTSTASEFAVSSGESGSARPGEKDRTYADGAAVVKLAGEVRPRGSTKHSTVTESIIAVSHSEASWPRADAVDTAVAMLADEARPPGNAKQSATTEPELAESSDGAGPSWSRASGNSAATTAAVKSAGEARPSRIVKNSVTSESESELAEDWEPARVASRDVVRGNRSEKEAWKEARASFWRNSRLRISMS